MSQTSGLTVRQHEREGINVPVEFIICDEHKSQVHFSSASSALGQHAIKATALDISPGGMGLETRQFIPRMCEGTLRVLVPDAVQIADQGTPVYVPAFEHRAKVRRVFLTGRDPVYTVGVAFLNAGPDMDEQIAKLLKQLSASGKALRMRPIAGSISPGNAGGNGGGDA